MRSAASSTNFVGRQPELGQLSSMLAQARAGQPQVLLLTGDAGVGKTRLLNEAGQIARQAGMAVLIGGSINVSEGSVPLAPLAEALRGVQDRFSAAEAAEIADAAPDLFALMAPGATGANAGLAAGSAPAAHDVGRPGRLFEQVLDILGRLARVSPAMLVFEDIHWADRSTFDLLRFLVRNMRPGTACALVATCRSDDPSPAANLQAFLADMGRANVDRIELVPFSRPELQAQLDGIVGHGVDQELLDRIFRLSGGNAFYAEELIASPQPDRLPPSLGDVLTARLELVPPSARALMHIAAVTGPLTTDDLLVAISGQPTDEVRASLHHLVESGLFVRSGHPLPDALVFRHALLHDAAYRRLLPGERRSLHAAAATYLERSSRLGDDVAVLTEIARHWNAAGEPAPAFAASVRAAAAAEASHAPAEAAVQYRRALELLSEVPQLAAEAHLDRAELLERGARCAAVDSPRQAVQLIREALGLVDASRDGTRAGLLHERLGRYLWLSGDGAGAMESCAAAARLVPAEPVSVARARVTAGLGQILMILARFEESRPICTEALTVAQAVGARDVEAHALNTLGQDMVYLDDVEGGIAMLRSSLELSKAIGSVEDAGRAYANLMDSYKISGRFGDAIALADEAFEFCLRNGLVGLYGTTSLCYAAWAAYRAGRWDEADALLERARFYRIEGQAELELLNFSALIDVGRGDYDAARRRLDMIERLQVSVIDTQLIAPYTEARAELAIWMGDPDEALRVVHDGVHRAEPPIGANVCRIGPLYALGIRAAADVVDLARARDRARVRSDVSRGAADLNARMEAAHHSIADRWRSHLPMADAYRALCQAEWSRLAEAAGPDHWQTAVQALDAVGLRYLAAYARWRWASALLSSKMMRAKARDVLNDAYAASRELGADPLSGAVSALADRARVSLGRPPTRQPATGKMAALTGRELEVLSLIVQGRSNRQIANELFISEKTAGHHVSSILAKLGVGGRTEAASLAVQSSLLE